MPTDAIEQQKQSSQLHDIQHRSEPALAGKEPTMNDDATPAKVRLTDGLGLAPERAAVERLMKRCQIGVGPRQMGEAHDIMAECYGTLGRQQIEIEQLRAALLDARDCRTCRNFTTRSGGCVSVLRCVDGSGYQRQGRFQYWEAAPLDPAPF